MLTRRWYKALMQADLLLHMLLLRVTMQACRWILTASSPCLHPKRCVRQGAQLRSAQHACNAVQRGGLVSAVHACLASRPAPCQPTIQSTRAPACPAD